MGKPYFPKIAHAISGSQVARSLYCSLMLRVDFPFVRVGPKVVRYYDLE